MMTSKKQVLLFGLSANPPTGKGGHLGIVEYFQSKYDEIWILPVFKHMYASKQGLAPFEDRMAMCKLAFQQFGKVKSHLTPRSLSITGIDNVHVKTTEKTLVQQAPPDSRVDTYSVVCHFQASFPDTAFSLLLGGDTYRDLLAGKWTNGDKLQQIISLVVLQREGVSVVQNRTTMIEIPELKDVSSTLARSTTDVAVLSELLEPQVIEYIREHQLYAFGKRENC